MGHFLNLAMLADRFENGGYTAMNQFTYSYPAKVYFGQGAAKKAFQAEMGKAGKTVMVGIGGGSVKKTAYSMSCVDY